MKQDKRRKGKKVRAVEYRGAESRAAERSEGRRVTEYRAAESCPAERRGVKHPALEQSRTNYLLTVAYDGSGFVGWQYQPSRRTVQGTLNQTLKAVFKQEIKVDGAGRTDAGVHALGQLASFSMKGRVKPEKIKHVLNHALVGDIRVVDVQEVPADFHARYHATGKTYVYKIKNTVPNYAQSAMESKYHYFVEKPLDVEAMRKAARSFVGKHDFKNYCASGHGKKSTVRRIKGIEIEAISSSPSEIIIRVTGEGFLWKMVRMMVQTLVDVGVGDEKADNVSGLLKKKNRKKEAAPACGLYLEKVWFQI